MATLNHLRCLSSFTRFPFPVVFVFRSEFLGFIVRRFLRPIRQPTCWCRGTGVAASGPRQYAARRRISHCLSRTAGYDAAGRSSREGWLLTEALPDHATTTETLDACSGLAGSPKATNTTFACSPYPRKARSVGPHHGPTWALCLRRWQMRPDAYSSVSFSRYSRSTSANPAASLGGVAERGDCYFHGRRSLRLPRAIFWHAIGQCASRPDLGRVGTPRALTDMTCGNAQTGERLASAPLVPPRPPLPSLEQATIASSGGLSAGIPSIPRATTRPRTTDPVCHHSPPDPQVRYFGRHRPRSRAVAAGKASHRDSLPRSVAAPKRRQSFASLKGSSLATEPSATMVNYTR